jgi:hypothetical protein
MTSPWLLAAYSNRDFGSTSRAAVNEQALEDPNPSLVTAFPGPPTRTAGPTRRAQPAECE